MKHRKLRQLALTLPFALTPLSSLVQAAENVPALPTADIAVESSRTAPNDQFRAMVYYEASDANPAELARKVNAVVSQALQTARGFAAVKMRSAGNSTTPVYSKNGRTIESWRMRSTLALESKDSAQISELIGKLQQTMAVASLSAAPSEETWKKIEDETIADALSAFEARARLVANSLHKKWKIKHVSVNTSGPPSRPPMMAMARGAAMMAEAAPAPLEAGDSPVSVSVNGQIELTE